MALGAESADVLRIVLRRGFRLAGIGLAIGLVGALALGRVVRTLLYATSPTDAVTLVSVAAVLLTVAGLASYFPARRATRVDPTVACVRLTRPLAASSRWRRARGLRDGKMPSRHGLCHYDEHKKAVTARPSTMAYEPNVYSLTPHGRMTIFRAPSSRPSQVLFFLKGGKHGERKNSRRSCSMCLVLYGAAPGQADVVAEFNALAERTATAMPPARGGPPGLFDLALVHVAMHHAVQAIQHDFEPYLAAAPASGKRRRPRRPRRRRMISLSRCVAPLTRRSSPLPPPPLPSPTPPLPGSPPSLPLLSPPLASQVTRPGLVARPSEPSADSPIPISSRSDCVLAPALADLHEEAQEHLGAQEVLDLLAGLGADGLSMDPPLPMRMPFWLSRSTRMAASMRTRPCSSLKDSITHARGVGDLLARQAQDPLAHHLGHEEALGQVGEEVLGIEALALAEVRHEHCSRRPRSRRRSRRSARCRRSRPGAPVVLDHGQDLRLGTRSILLSARITGRPRLLEQPLHERVAGPGGSVTSMTHTASVAPGPCSSPPCPPCGWFMPCSACGCPACRRARAGPAAG